MSKNILLAVDTAAHDPARHVVAAADMTRELAHDSGDHVIVLHIAKLPHLFGELRALHWRALPAGTRRASHVVTRPVQKARELGWVAA